MFATRGDLQMKMGDEVSVNCKSCGKMEKIHINKVNAVVNNKLIIIALAIGVIVTIVLWNFFGAIGTISGTIPIMVFIYENKATHAFNSYKIRRK